MTGLNPEMSVAQIVLNHSECAPVLQRYRIDYCCKGEQPLSAACAQRGADPAQVLAQLEKAVSERSAITAGIDPRDLSTDVLIQHVVNRYHRSLREGLPFAVALAKKVARVHGEHNPKLVGLHEQVEALSEAMLPHMDQEESVLFPSLTASVPDRKVISRELAAMHTDHLEVANILRAIRAAADDFAIPDWACTSYRTLFGELQAIEGELFTHVHLENYVLMPRFVAEQRSA